MANTGGAGFGLRTFVNQPRGLYPLFFTEMWERFNFYIVTFLLALYLREALGYSAEWTSDISTWYMALVYFTPFLGGLAADRVLGYGRSILAGGLLMAAGNVCLAVDSPASRYHQWLFLGLGLLILGNGLFKPNISALVGKLYAKDDPRRDQGFTIFYMGINIGALLAPLASSVILENGVGWADRLFGIKLPEKAGWSLAFAAGSIGMLIGSAIFSIYRQRFAIYDRGNPESPGGADDPNEPLDPRADAILRRGQNFNIIATVAALVGLLFLPLLPWSKVLPTSSFPAWMTPTTIFAVAWIAIEAISIGIFLSMRDQVGLNAARLKMIFVVIALFWMAFHQNAVTLTFFANEKIRSVSGDPFPINQLTDPMRYQAINALCVVLLSPLMAMLWGALDGRGRGLSMIGKMTAGMLLTAGAYALMVCAGWAGADVPGKSRLVAPYWLIGTYVILTIAELCLSPVGLSLTSRLAPARYKGLWMGFWFLSTAVGNKLIHIVGQYWQTIDPKTGEVVPGTYPPSVIFQILVISSLAAAALLLVFDSWLKRRQVDAAPPSPAPNP